MRRLFPLLALAILGSALVVHALRFGSYLVDDAGITFAYARNLAEGHGPVAIVGEAPTEGYSNPAWTFLMAALMALGLFDLVWTPKTVGLACVVAGGAVAAWIVHRLTDAPRQGATPWLPLLVWTANGSYVLWAVAGLENAQYALTILAAFAIYLRDVDHPSSLPRSGPLFFLAAISRPEGLVYTLAAGTDALVRAARRRDPAWLGKLVAGLALPAVAYVGWHLATFGSMVPNTYLVKARHVSWAARWLDLRSGGWTYLLDGLTTWGQGPLLLLAVLGLLHARTWARGGAALALGLLASMAFPLQANGDWMMGFRFLSPTYALAGVLGAVGLQVALDRLDAPRTRLAVGWAAALGLAGWVGKALPEAHARYDADPTVPLHDRMARLPRYLAVTEALGLAQPTLLLSDMGGPMWVNDDQQAVIVDMFGLCDRTVAQALHDEDLAALHAYGLDARDPAIIQFPPTLHRRWALAGSDRFAEGWMPLDDHRAADAPTGVWLRRDLVEAPWSPRFADGLVVRQGPLRVHAARVVDSAPGRAVVEVDASLARPTGRTPSARLRLIGARETEVEVPILPMLSARALAPDRVYRTRRAVALPDDLGRVSEATAVGEPVPSDLPPPPRRVTHDLLTGGSTDADGFLTVPDAAATPVDAGLRYAADGEAENKLCGPWHQGAGDVRVDLALARTTPGGLGGRLDLDLRWLDADGAFLERRVVHRVEPGPLPASVPRLRAAPPEGAATVRACLAAREGPVDVTLTRWVVDVWDR